MTKIPPSLSLRSGERGRSLRLETEVRGVVIWRLVIITLIERFTLSPKGGGDASNPFRMRYVESLGN
jgi:hypothetical protein